MPVEHKTSFLEKASSLCLCWWDWQGAGPDPAGKVPRQTSEVCMDFWAGKLLGSKLPIIMSL